MNRRAADPALSSVLAPLLSPALLLTGVLCLAAPHAALAQLAPSSNAPVDVTADQLEVQNQKCLAVWSGDAEALQATSRLRANVINIYNKALPSRAGQQPGQNCGQLDRMEADGAVYYVTPNQIVKGDHAVYSADDKTIVITGDVVVAQGRNVSSATRLVINTDTGVADMASNVTGRGKSGRVRAVLYPNQPLGGAAAADSASASGGLKAPVPPPPRKHGG
ncbi:MAG: organic solvent tolerance protein OstA [Caulobacteraceae bacterium]|nr:organic solvent tolerance protein OstA [Caulobacteraceae bacterium]